MSTQIISPDPEEQITRTPITDVVAFLALAKSYEGGLLTLVTTETAKKGRITKVEVNPKTGRVEFYVRYKWKMAGLIKRHENWPIPTTWAKVPKQSGVRTMGNVQEYMTTVRPDGVLVLSKRNTFLYWICLRPASQSADALSGF